MSLSSELLEDYSDRISAIFTQLGKLGNSEVRDSGLLSALGDMAKEWLRLSTTLRNTADGFIPNLDPYDLVMADVLQSTKGRCRASTYRRKLEPFLERFLDDVVIGYMRYEGSPAQASARQVEAVFSDVINFEELAYVQEAARCSSQHCHRAAVIMLWTAAMARIHGGVQRAGFMAFNDAVASINQKKGLPYVKLTKNLTVSNLADLQKARDTDILIVGMELWKYDLQVYEEQERLLGTRNSAAHPGMFQPVAIDVRQFAEKVRRYVFEVVK